MLAQFAPTLSFDEIARIGMGFVIFAWVAQLIANTYRAFKPYQPPLKQEEMYVTHAQFDARINTLEVQMNNKFDKIGMQLEAKLQAFSSDFGGRVIELDKYIHESTHRTNDALQKVFVTQAEMKGMLSVKHHREEENNQ